MYFQFDIDKHDNGWFWGLWSEVSRGTPSLGTPGYYMLTSDDFGEAYFKTRAACEKSAEHARKTLLAGIADAPIKHPLQD